MPNYSPQVEIMPSSQQVFSTGEVLPWYKAPRARMFLLVFSLVAAVGVAFTYLQPPIFQSQASVLMSALTAVDRSSEDEDIQHVAIQRRILLGSELVERTRQVLVERGYISTGQDDIARLLSVEPVEGTNLVEMVATGEDKGLLPNLVDTWIEVYLLARASDMAQSLGDTHKAISDEIDDLKLKVSIARQELSDYRADNNIVSAERAENEALARLKGINESLNNALEDEVRAKSELDAVREALARGETVVPKQDQQTLSSLEIELQELKLQLTELDQRYTREYLARQPSLKVIPENIAKLEVEIANRSAAGGQVVLNEASQAYVAANKTVENIRRQYDEHKSKVEKFTQIFLVHQSLVNDLENLEGLHRDSQSRLVQLEVSQVQRYPQVNVIAPATVPRKVGPDYPLNVLIALGIAMLIALFVVWLSSFLGHQKPDMPPITVTGVRVYAGDNTDGLEYKTDTAALEQHAHALEGHPPQPESAAGSETPEK